MVSDRIKEFFPYPLIRESQSTLMQDMELALEQQKIILAHAPTGLGKTISALAVALPYALEKKKTIFFLTNRHTQHDIALETLKAIQKHTGKEIKVVDLIGKRAMCSQSVAQLFGNDFSEYCKHVVEHGECEFYNKVYLKKALTVEAKDMLKKVQAQGPLKVEELKLFLEESKMCSYEIAMNLAKDTNVIIGDYNYAFHPFVQNSILNKMQKELEDLIIIIDEAHNLPSRITDMLSHSLNSNMIKNALIEAKKFRYDGLLIWLQDLMRILTVLGEFSPNEDKERKIEKIEFIQRVKNHTDYDNLINEIQIAADEIRKKQQRSYLGGIASFLEAWKNDDEGYVRSITEKRSKFGPIISLNYDCLDPRVITKDIFAHIHAGMLMSGTLQPLFMYKDVLGIESTRAQLGEYPSPFPPENKITLIVPETTTKYTLRGSAMYQQIAQKCSEFAKLIPGNIAFFFPSYDIRDQICPFFDSPKPRFWEKADMTKDDKETLLTQFKDAKHTGGLLLGVCGANFAEGIDFPGDLLQGVVIIGLPLAKPDLKTRAMIAYYDLKFGRGWDYGYTFPALNKCFQSAGRCIRSETDRGAVIYLDERFAWTTYFNCFPKEGLRVSKDYTRLLEDFFRKI